MNICIVSVSFNPDLGGVVSDVANELSKLGHSVTIFTGGSNKRGGEWIEQSMYRLFRAYSFDVPWKLRSYVCVRNLVVEQQFKRFLKETKPDVVHVNQLYYQFPYALVKIARQSTNRVFVTGHDVNAFSDRKLTCIVSPTRNPNDPDPTYQYPWYKRLRDTGLGFNPFRNFFIRRYLRSATNVITVSDALQRAFVDNGICNVATIHNGIDAAQWQIQKSKDESKQELGLQGKGVILTIGRLSGEKGREPLFNSFVRVRKLVPNATLVLIGDDAGGKWKEEIQKRGLEDAVVSRQFVSRSDLPRWYGAADVVVVPSICFDSFPTINLEAMASARPVIATCYGGSRELVVDGETGFIVNPQNTDDLTQKIVSLLNTPSLAERMGKDGFERVSKYFRLDQQVNILLRYYQ